MKRKQILLTLASIAFIASACDKNEQMQTFNPNLESVTFRLQTEQAKTKQTGMLGVNRYIMEVYADEDATAKVTCFDATGGAGAVTHRAVNATGVFTVDLLSAKTYTILFWADDGSAGANNTYNADNLKAVSLVATQTMSQHAYFLNKTGKVNASQDIVLNRAVAQIKYVQNGAYPDVTDNDTKTVKITYDKTYSFNCVTSNVNESETTPRTHTFAAKQIVNDANFGSDYHFADATTTAGQKTLVGITINVEEEDLAGIDVGAIPIKANQTTKLHGQYSAHQTVSSTFTITSVNEWSQIELIAPHL